MRVTAKVAIGKHISLIIPPEYINDEKKSFLEFGIMKLLSISKQFEIKTRAGSIIGVSKIARDFASCKKSETSLIHANKELVFQKKEKEKRAAELIIANEPYETFTSIHFY